MTQRLGASSDWQAGVYWPTTDDPHAYLNKASDHKLVWIEIKLP